MPVKLCIRDRAFQAMQNLGKLSEEEAQKSFIHRIRKLETFGQSFFSVTVSISAGLYA